MDAVSSGLTWAELQARFAEDSEYSLVLNNVRRRTKKGPRNRGELDERTLWRCFVQHFDGCQITTVYRKNIRFEGDDLGAEVVPDQVVHSINHAIG